MKPIFKEEAWETATPKLSLWRQSSKEGVQINVPLKLINAPTLLVTEWESVLHKCSRTLTETLVKFHSDLISSHQKRADAEKVVGLNIVIPEFITEFEDINE